MKLRFAHLADYAATDSGGKLTLVGAFDVIWDVLKARPIQFPACYLVVSLEASIAEGAEHELHIRLVDDDEQQHGNGIVGRFRLRAQGPGHPARAHLIFGFPAGVIQVPAPGDYYFRVDVDGSPVDQLLISVLEPAKQE